MGPGPFTVHESVPGDFEPPGFTGDCMQTARRLDKIESLNPRAVIAAHKRPGNDDNPRIIEETKQYIRDFDRIAEITTTAQELYDKMLDLYPNRVNPGWALWSSARAVKQ